MAPLGAADKAAIEGFLRTEPHPGPELPRACFACMCPYLVCVVCTPVLYGVFCPPTLARALWRGERRGSTVVEAQPRARGVGGSDARGGVKQPPGRWRVATKTFSVRGCGA